MSFFCSLPFNSVQVLDDGVAVPCCVYRPEQRESLLTYFDSPEIASVKQQMLDGVAPKQCQQCVDSERLYGHSFRLISQQFESDEATIREINDKNYFNIRHVLATTSNTCNLMCIMCNHQSYPRWRELNKMGYNDNPAEIIESQHMDRLLDLENVELMSFSGGEPFLDRITLDFLDKVIASGRAKNIKIHLNSNITHVKRDVITRLRDNFREVQIKASIDGVGKAFEYLRYPARWQDVLDSINLIKDVGRIELIITGAISNTALIRFDEVFVWAYENDIPDIFLTPVHGPELTRFDFLPNQVKAQIRDKYVKLKNNPAYHFSNRTAVAIDACIQMCDPSPVDREKDFHRVITWLNKHDEFRQTDFLSLWPELAQYK